MDSPNTVTLYDHASEPRTVLVDTGLSQEMLARIETFLEVRGRWYTVVYSTRTLHIQFSSFKLIAHHMCWAGFVLLCIGSPRLYLPDLREKRASWLKPSEEN
jgi:hypothetical protein